MEIHQRVILIAGSPEYDRAFIETALTTPKFHDAPIFAIDAGLNICDSLNKIPTKIIGDFDSLDIDLLDKFPTSLIYQYPADKDQSDTEIAIELAITEKYQEIYLFNATGGRLDHLFLNAQLLFKSPQKIIIVSEHGAMWGISAEEQQDYSFNLPINTLFSLIPWGLCEQVSLRGCKYPLIKRNLSFSSLTLSNIAISPIKLTIKKGFLFFYIPVWKSVVIDDIFLFKKRK